VQGDLIANVQFELLETRDQELVGNSFAARDVQFPLQTVMFLPRYATNLSDIADSVLSKADDVCAFV